MTKISEEQKKEILSQLPEWMVPEPGFKFLDEDDEQCIVLGWGSFRDFDIQGNVNYYDRKTRETQYHSIGSIVLIKSCLIIAAAYRGEFHLCSATKMNLKRCKPIEPIF
jgi:hypothetical protein